MKKLQFIIYLLCIAFLISACNENKNVIYVEASSTESNISISDIQDLELDLAFSYEESAPYCYIINNSNICYITGYGTLEVFLNGKWMMAKCQDPACIPEIAFSVPANSVSTKIPVFISVYGNTFLPGKYRAIFELSEDSDKIAVDSANYYIAQEFTIN